MGAGPESGCDRLIEFEARLNEFLVESRSVIVCLYDRRRFDPAVIHDVVRTHPVVVLGDQVYSNPYYEPPELVLSDERPASTAFKAKRLNWWIAQLKRTREALQRHTDQLQGLAEASLTINSAGSSAEVAQAVTQAARAIIGAHLGGTGFTSDENWRSRSRRCRSPRNMRPGAITTSGRMAQGSTPSSAGRTSPCG